MSVFIFELEEEFEDCKEAFMSAGGG